MTMASANVGAADADADADAVADAAELGDERRRDGELMDAVLDEERKLVFELCKDDTAALVARVDANADPDVGADDMSNHDNRRHTRTCQCKSVIERPRATETTEKYPTIDKTGYRQQQLTQERKLSPQEIRKTF